MTLADWASCLAFLTVLALVIPETRAYIARTTTIAVSRWWLWYDRDNLLSAQPVASDDRVAGARSDEGSHAGPEPSVVYSQSQRSISVSQSRVLRRGCQAAPHSGQIELRFGSLGFFRSYDATLDGCSLVLRDVRSGALADEFPFHGGKAARAPRDPRMLTVTDSASRSVVLRAATEGECTAWLRALDHNLYAEVSDAWIAAARTRTAGFVVA
jgi:hypothetical protein